jgi:hypothetical protein
MTTSAGILYGFYSQSLDLSETSGSPALIYTFILRTLQLS